MTEPADGHERAAESASAQVSRDRPFYSRHAEAYDLLITDPVGPWVEAVHDALVGGGRAPGDVLDAGCGTGRHAAALVELGHRVTLADVSPDLLAIASRRCPSSRSWLVDLTSPFTDERFDAVACRGVLNDLLSDAERQGAIDVMASCLRGGGVLLCDVREATAAAERADGTPRTITVPVPGAGPGGAPGTLTFTSAATWGDGLLHVREEHVVTTAEGTSRSRAVFRMRPWTVDELVRRLDGAGLSDVDVRPGVGRRTPDRLLVVARRS